MEPTKNLLLALDRCARIQILGVARLLDQSERPRHRPKTAESAIKQDEIAQLFLYARTLDPKRPSKDIVGSICDYYKIKRTYVYNVLSKISPERKKNIEFSAMAFAEWYASKKLT